MPSPASIRRCKLSSSLPLEGAEDMVNIEQDYLQLSPASSAALSEFFSSPRVFG
ncbi:MAG: hypothetical protein M3Y53_09420 [Thermoproteota archaeon]|nr:hypothetical protein [Thermoproteota archaeon]